MEADEAGETASPVDGEEMRENEPAGFVGVGRDAGAHYVLALALGVLEDVHE